ncbi:Rv3235 family protein [Curtobacterium aurantiacum]|uniref:Rv3235 family protein n=1 Tax=Curtobacterium aurantiacum TaxID=3236919 RepID=UPI001BDE8508|nr:Rv3235 family protein [Curtobacterium flaccumfaciens]MBT1677985.1 3-hydroxyacyl-CoA dehydrogenase [Curtobacterium flaccumfaciens pv. flaccumfaciens]
MENVALSTGQVHVYFVCRTPHTLAPTTEGAGVAEQARRIEDATTTVHPPPLRIVEPDPDPVEETGPPDPATTARALGLCVAEVLTGAREVDSIARWISDDVQRHLQQRAAVAAQARGSSRRARGRPVLRVGSVLVCRPAAGVAEATVVVHTRSHARAVAMRLEERHGRWQATAIGVL